MPVDGGPEPVDAGVDAGPTPPDKHCSVDLSRFVVEGPGAAQARVVEGQADLVDGPNAQGRIGDFRLSNEHIVAVVQNVDRHIGPLPYGGTLLDLDFAVDGGGDQLGEVGLNYNFGRTIDPELVEVLADGSDGGAAIVVATGADTANDYLSMRQQLVGAVGRMPVANPYVSLPLRLSSYFIVNPGEQRVRIVTAFCNQSATDELALAVGDLTDPGYVVELWNGRSCSGGFGYGGLCYGMDRMSWYGYQGQGIAYGYSPYRVGAGNIPESQNALLTVAGVSMSLVGAGGIPGLVSWFDDAATNRPGQLTLRPGQRGVLARDVWVGRDLGEVATLVESSRSTALGQLFGTVTAQGAPVAGARVVVRTQDEFSAVYTTNAAGKFSGLLARGSYAAAAWKEGCEPSPEKTFDLVEGGSAVVSLELTPPRRLTVTVTEVGVGPTPARVTVLCGSGACATPQSELQPYFDAAGDPVLQSMAKVAFVPASGTITLPLPPGQYQVVVSRGPEYSVFPNSWPHGGGEPVDLRTQNATVHAVLARVLDTTDWMSADFHVHAVNSPDSIIDNSVRALSFAGDGVDIVVSTDHDYVTDYEPTIRSLGLTPFLASIVGEEISTMDYGHYNAFPLTPSGDLINQGALDWAGGRGATLDLAKLFAAARARGARTLHFNHPRGNLGGLSLLRVDTDTFATHIDPADLRMEPIPGATAADTRLMSSDFNALEVLNSSEDLFDPARAHSRFNDWFVMLSRGLPVAGTGVSDTHYRNVSSGWRTWVWAGADAAPDMVPSTISASLNRFRAFASNGPFVRIAAYRVTSSGTQVTPSVDMGGTVAAMSLDLGVTVEVWVPEYLDVTRIELYLHRPEDDAACPLDPGSPRAATTRVACNGQANLNWPSQGIAATRMVSLGPSNLQTVTVSGGISYRRWNVRETFRLPAPKTDNWLVAMVYGSKSLFPLVYAPTRPGSPASAVAPFAFTNPVFIDADGNGYDKPPFAPVPPVPIRTPPAPQVREPIPPTDEILRRWGEWTDRH